MSHTPFGYRIENGKAIIDSEAAEKVKKLFQYYLSGDSLVNAAKKLALNPIILVLAGCLETPVISVMNIIL